LLPDRLPALYSAALGTLKNGSVLCPLFSAFGPEPIQARMSIGKARVLVTTTSLYKRKVEQLRDRLPDLQHVLLVDGNLDALMQNASPEFAVVNTQAEDLAL